MNKISIMAISRRTCLLLALVFVSVFAGWQGIGASYAVSAGDSPASGVSARLDSSLEELTIGADSVVVGTVVERSSYWNDEHTRIYTSVVLSLDDIFKGKISQDRITVTFLGGEAEGIGERVSDMPSFDQGEKAVVFLKKLSREQIPHTTVSQEQLSEEQFEVYGGFHGKFTVMGDKVGNLPMARFKGHVNKILNGQTLSDDELDIPLSPIISPYSYSGYCWPHPPSPVVNYLVNENTPDCTDEGAAVRAAAATWSAAGAYFSFSYAGTTSATTVTQNFVNEILWTNLGSGDTLALTTTWYYTSNNNIFECDMEFNEYYTWSTSGQYDIQTVALHEFGHYLLLGHSSDINAVMYFQYQGIRRALHADDIAGIRSIYGALPAAPTVTNSIGTSSVTPTSARLNGEITSTGNENPTVYIYWGPSDGSTIPGNWAHSVNLGVKAAGTFYTDISSLTAGTPYYYRCYAVNSGGGSWAASTTSFNTSVIAPTVTNSIGASNIESSSARLNGEVTSNGGENSTVHIYWGQSDGGTTPGTWAHEVNLGVKAPGTLYTDISSLTASTPYYYRCYAVNSGGGSWATSTSSFTTLKALVSIAITPDNPNIAKGQSQQLTATGSYSDNSTENLTASVTWTSDTLSVATIGENDGLALSLAEGQATITATLGAISDTTILTVSAKVLDSLAVTPDSPTIPTGRTQQFTATGTYSDNSTENLTSSVTWTSDNTTVATIGENTGIAQSLAEGQTMITATLGAISDTTVLTVGPKVLDSIAITPDNPTIAKGQSQQFTATGTFSDASIEDITASVTWSSDNTAVVTIGEDTGLAQGSAEGQATITTVLGLISDTTILTVTKVLNSIAVTPEIISVPAGRTQQFTATGTFSDNSTADLTGLVSWSSSNITVASVNAAGLATTYIQGTADVTAALDGVSDRVTLTIDAHVLDSITITPDSPVINLIASSLQTQQFIATAVYSDGPVNVTDTASWVSDNTTVATIDAAGLATIFAIGTTTISAAYEDKTENTTLQVTNPPPLPPPAGGGATGGSSGSPTNTTRLAEYTNENGEFIDDAVAYYLDGQVQIFFPKGTAAKNKYGQRLPSVSIKESTAPPPLTADCQFVCLAYEIGPSGATFNPPALLSFLYSDSLILTGVAEENLVFVTWQDGQWIELEGCVVDAANNIVTVPISHLTVFTVIAYTTPASFEVAGMTVTPAESQLRVPVTISLTVTNTGDLTGDFTVALKINNVSGQSKAITLKGGESRTVTFTLIPDDAGVYTVTIGGLSGRFTIKEPEPASEPEGTVTVELAPKPEPTPEPTSPPEEKQETMAQPEPESTPESELPAAPQEEPIPSAGISWWLTVIFIVAGIAVVGLATIIVISKRRH